MFRKLGSVDLFSIWDAFRGKKNYLFSPAGLIPLKEMRFNWIRQIAKRRLDRKRGLIRLNMLEWIRLSVFEEIRPPEGEETDAEGNARAFGRAQPVRKPPLFGYQPI